MKFLAIILVVLSSVPGRADYDRGYAEGERAGMNISGQTDSSDEINERFLKPGTSDGTPMRTFESTNPDPDDPGPREFDFRVTNASTDSFLEVRAYKGATGDVIGIVVEQDTDFDKQYDHRYEAPAASGICINGLISCTSGTWDNCLFHRWIANGGRIGTERIDDISGLEGCYCVNAYCGSNIPIGLVVKDIGAGIVDAVQKISPNYMITHVESFPNSVRYYGQMASDAGSKAASPEVRFSGYENPEVFYDPEDDGNLNTYANFEKRSQENDSGSPLYALERSLNARMDPTNSETCVISRKVRLTETGAIETSAIDRCEDFDSTGCVLDRETVCDHNNKNCVHTIYDGAATGHTPRRPPVIVSDSETGRTWSVNTDGQTITYETGGAVSVLESGTDLWWNIRRTWLCESERSYGDRATLTTANTAAGTAAKDGDILVYDEYDSETGTTTRRSARIPEAKTYYECEKGCEVRRYETKTDATVEANSWDYQRSVDSVTTIYKSCGVDEICPAEGNEEIVQDCRCLNEFTKANTYLQVIREAGNDLICAE